MNPDFRINARRVDLQKKKKKQNTSSFFLHVTLYGRRETGTLCVYTYTGKASKQNPTALLSVSRFRVFEVDDRPRTRVPRVRPVVVVVIIITIIIIVVNISNKHAVRVGDPA